MTPSEGMTAMLQALAADRLVDIGKARELVSDYLAWRSSLAGRSVAPWEERLARRYLDETLLFEGRPTVVFAGQGKGKSNFAAWVIQKVLETRPNTDIYTNLPFAWQEDPASEGLSADPRLKAITSLSELLRGSARTLLSGRVPAALIDEFDQAVTSHNWRSEAAQSWQMLINIERHLRIRGPFLIYHAYRHIPVVLREGTMLKALTQVVVDRGRHWLVQREQPGYLGIPQTVLPYLRYGLRGFKIDVDVADLEQSVSGGHLSVARQIIDYLDERQLEAERKREKKRRAEERKSRALDLREAGWTQRRIADELGVSQPRVLAILRSA